MAFPVMYKGSDEVIMITVTDGESPIDLTTATDIIVTCYQTKAEIIQQWRLSEGDVSIVDASAGKCKVNLDRDNTENLPEKRIYVQVDLKLTNADFEGGFAIEKDIKPLCDLKNSVT